MTHDEHDQNLKVGTGYFGMLSAILTGVFIGLKLTGIISWSWIYVVLPAIIYIALHLILWVMIAILTFAIMAKAFSEVKNKPHEMEAETKSTEKVE